MKEVYYLNLEDLEVSSGTALTQAQVDNSEKVVLIGTDAATELFKTESAVGKSIYFNSTAYKIVGVIKQKETTSSNAQAVEPGGANRIASSFITGYKAWLKQTTKTQLSSVKATAANEKVVESVADSIEAKLYSDHQVTKDNADVSVTISKDLLNTVSSVANSFTTTLAGIAAISLIVGGIGIMNIMLVTVTERTREIGLRRAIGAKSRHIVYQFLLESLMLTLIGGLIGVVIGIVFGSNASSLISTGFGRGPGGGTSDVKVIIDATTIVIAVGISSLIGVVFGLFPVIKASRLNPVDALRYE